jgi:hypothetical protein
MTTSVAFRLAFTAQLPTIVCSACGATELQAGIAVPSDAITTTRGETGDQSTVNTSMARPLCEACVKLLMVAQQG